jgi:uncharacterized repeat protein (TIGR04076 family)
MVNKLEWKFFKKHLKYNDEEMKIFKENPRNEAVISKARELQKKTIIIEVIHAQGCNTQHAVGDKFVFDGFGNLITKLSPSRICVGILSSLAGLIFGAHELMYAGVDPNTMKFNTVDCIDVGVRCGGWGKVVVQLRVEDRK